MQMKSDLMVAVHRFLASLVHLAFMVCLDACSKSQTVRAGQRREEESVTTVGVTCVTRKPLMRQITLSSELVPFQEIDVYAKEAGYVKDQLVDYGSRVQKGQLMAVLEIPELELQLKQDTAGIEGAGQQVSHAEHEVDRLQAVHRVAHLQADRLNGVAKTRPGLVAQQEIDDARGKDLALEAQMEAGRSTLQTVKSELEEAKAKLQHDRAIFDYARITAPLRV